MVCGSGNPPRIWNAPNNTFPVFVKCAKYKGFNATFLGVNTNDIFLILFRVLDCHLVHFDDSKVGYHLHYLLCDLLDMPVFVPHTPIFGVVLSHF